MDREGIGLLRKVIEITQGMDVLVQSGDCKSIAIAINAGLPGDLEVFPNDVFLAIKDRKDFGGVHINIEMLRARIDKMPVLYSARLSGDYQAIMNELYPEIVGLTIAEVKAAMELRAVPKPTLVSSGSVELIGTARIG